MIRFLTQNKVGRRITIWLHPRLHPGISEPLRFGGSERCWLCVRVMRDHFRRMPPIMDRSSIKLSEPEYNEDGTVKRRGMTMTATAKRQLDEIMASDPKAAAAIQEMMDKIATEDLPTEGD